MSAGRFISLEGTEGGGKSTHTGLLAGRLRQAGRTVIALREPGGTPLGEEIRHLLKHSPAGQAMTPETELLLLNASRAQLVQEVIRPALLQGTIVLCDRFADSSIAYQSYGRGLDLEEARRVIRFATGGLVPDLTLWLSVPVEVSEARRAARRAGETGDVSDRFEEANRDFFHRVEEGFRALAAREPGRIKMVDATQPIEVVQESIWRHVAGCLGV